MTTGCTASRSSLHSGAGSTGRSKNCIDVQRRVFVYLHLWPKHIDSAAVSVGKCFMSREPGYTPFDAPPSG